MALSKITNLSITDDAVRTVGIQDDNVTLAKLGDGTQGDILYYGASGAPARLGFGTSGDFLKTQGTGANPVWATAGGDNTPSFWAGRTVTVTGISSGVATKVEFNTEDWDTDGEYDHTTNYRFTPQTAGKYFFSAGVQCYAADGMSKMSRMYLKLYLNGSAWSRSTLDLRNNLYYEGVPPISGAISLNGSSDYIEVYIQAITDSGTLNIDGNSTPSQNWFTAFKILGA